MVKVTAAQPGIYSATYSNIPVFEFQFGAELKEHVMRRRSDDWINATHILKAAGFDKPARTRILEREVQKDTHEKIQGGYGKYQGTWIPLDAGEALAHRNNVYERLRPIFEFEPGLQTPPPAPRHSSKPKAAKPKPAVPKWTNVPVMHEEYDEPHGEDETPDNVTVVTGSYMGEDDRFDIPHPTGGNRKRKREDAVEDMTEQQHSMYGDGLLDYFLLSRNSQPAYRPEPPTNFQPNWIIDSEKHTALHWAASMGDVDVIRQLKRFGASLDVVNVKGETPLMRAVYFTNCYEKQTFPSVLRELFETVDARDGAGSTVIHHAASMRNGRVQSHTCSRYYLDCVLNRLQETHEPAFIQALVDAQDAQGNTALHLAAQRNARKCIRALLGRGASTDLANLQGVRAEDLIRELNASRQQRQPQRSSSPFAPDSQRHASFRDIELGGGKVAAAGGRDKLPSQPSYQSQAAMTVQARVAPLVSQKLADLAASYEDEWRDKDEAEREARRILANAQVELASLHQQTAEATMELQHHQHGVANGGSSRQQKNGAADAADAMAAAERARADMLALVALQSRVEVQDAVEAELHALMINGNGGRANGVDAIDGIEATGANGTDEGLSTEQLLQLARELHALVGAQRVAEGEYVDALSRVGTGEYIDKYRRLLRKCLDPRDADNLDDNLDSLIEMMEEDVLPDGNRVDVSDGAAAAAAAALVPHPPAVSTEVGMVM